MPASIGVGRGLFAREATHDAIAQRKNLQWRGRHGLPGTAVSGAGAITFSRPALSGSGQQFNQGSGSVTIGAPLLSNFISGTGSVTMQAPTLSALLGSGGIAIGAPSLNGSGVQQFFASGGIAISAPTLKGTNIPTHVSGEFESGSDVAG